jgi:hypothetical protein
MTTGREIMPTKENKEKEKKEKEKKRMTMEIVYKEQTGKQQKEDIKKEIEKLQSKLEAQKRRREATEEELKEEKAKRKKTQERKESCERETSRKEKELNDARAEVDRLQKAYTHLNTKRREQEEELLNQKKTAEKIDKHLREVLKTAEEQETLISEMQKKMEKMNIKIKELEKERTKNEKERLEEKQELESVGDTVRRQMKYIEELEQLNSDLLARVTKDTKKEKTKALLVADSNGREIIRHLQDLSMDWDRTTNTFKTEDLQYLKSQDLQKYSSIMIMLGTNNVKDGDDGYKEAERYMERVRELKDKTRAKVTVAQIPPIDRRNGRLEREIFNRQLKNRMTEITDVMETPEEQTKMAAVDILKDQLHLTESAAKTYALKMDKHCYNAIKGGMTSQTGSSSSRREERENRRERREDDRREERYWTGRSSQDNERERPRTEEPRREGWTTRECEQTTIPKRMLAQFFGRQGQNVHEMGKRFEVRITADERTDPAEVKIIGRRSREAKEEIEKFKERYEEREIANNTRRTDRREEPCRFFKQGRCDKGSKCFFSHATDTAVRFSNE